VLLRRRIARAVEAVLRRGRVVVARGRRVGLVVDLASGVRAPLRRERLEAAAGGLGVGSELRRVGRVALAATAGEDHDRDDGDDRDAQHDAAPDLQGALARRGALGLLLAGDPLLAAALLLLGTAGHRRRRRLGHAAATRRTAAPGLPAFVEEVGD